MSEQPSKEMPKVESNSGVIDLTAYLDGEGRIILWPSRKKNGLARVALLDRLAALLQPGEILGEREVNTRIAERVTGIDHAYIRRELVDTRRWCRTKDGREYQLAPTVWQETPNVTNNESI